MQHIKNILESHQLILMEAAIIEQLRRSDTVQLHPTLLNAPFIYDEAGKKALRQIFQRYMNIAKEMEVPFLMCTPTWRANRERVFKSNINCSINADAVRFMQDLRNSQVSQAGNIQIGGLIGCKHDCYKPHEGLSASKSLQFHAWQIDQLAQAGVDVLVAETLPNIEEAKGIAKAMEGTGMPYILSFVIARNGAVLDGTKLHVAVEMVDAATQSPPLGFMVNCAYPTFLCAAEQPKKLFKRLIGYQANASSLDHGELDGADFLKVEPINDWGEAMVELNRVYGVKILGGCCGTGGEHLKYIANYSKLNNFAKHQILGGRKDTQ